MVGAPSVLRWLDWIIQGPKFCIKYVAINKDLEKLPAQLLDFVKICYDQVVIATQ